MNYRNPRLKRDLIVSALQLLAMFLAPVVVVAFDYFHNVRHVF